MYKYKLSIIVPAYNTGKELERTLNTLVSQSLTSYEIIIINDNSSDDTENVVYNFQKEYNNIKYLKNSENQGAGLSRNVGFQNSSGKFITFLDSDDWPDLIAYKTAIDVLEENAECDFVIWGIKNEFNNQRSSYIRTDYNAYHKITKELALSLLCNTYSLDVTVSSYLGSKIFRRDFLKDNNICFNDILFEDVVFSFKSIVYSKKIILLPNIYTHYYQRTHSIVHSFTQKHISDMFKAFTLIRELVSKEFTDYNSDFASLVEKCSRTLFKLLYDNIENPMEQKEYLCFYFEELFRFCSIEKILEYMDSERIKNFLLNF